MRKFLIVTVTVLAALALMAATAFAITGNFVDDNEHPFVGLVVFYDQDGDFVWRCSGSLIAPNVLLTAGHCTDNEGGSPDAAWSARVYFRQDAGANYDPDLVAPGRPITDTGYDPVSGYPYTCSGSTGGGPLCATSDELYNYGFNSFAGFPNTHDAGLVILDQPIALSEYGQLPTAGVLNGLDTARGKKDTVFTVSGYGLSYRTAAHSAVPNISYRIRLMAESALVNLRSAMTDGYNLQTQGNGDDRGGTCSGDSGGPVFLGGPASNQIVAVTSFGLNSLCRGVDFAYRVDQPAVLDWIAAHMLD